MASSLRAEREQVLAFRLNRHNLTKRLPPDSLIEAANGGVRNTPPGSAILAFNARVQGLSLAQFEHALTVDKSLLETWSIGQSPCLFPTAEAARFTLALLPRSEAAWHAMMPTYMPTLKQAGVSALEAVKLTEVAISEVLAQGQVLSKGELSGLVSQRLPSSLVPWCNGCKTHHVHEVTLRLMALYGLFCFVPWSGKGVAFSRIDRWLGQPLAQADPDTARAALLRDYLGKYGPSNVQDFGKWAGIAATDANYCWQLIVAELLEVNFNGKKNWLLAADLSAFNASAVSFSSTSNENEVRLLPPYDAYLYQRDRETLLPEVARHKQVWRVLGNPGVVLLGSEIIGLWRPQKKGKALLLNIETFGPLALETHRAIVQEAELVAPLRGCTSAKVEFA